MEVKQTKAFGEKLKRLRNTAEFNQEEVANHLGISRQSISNWENNKSFPDLPNLIALSKMYQVTLDNLISEENVDMAYMCKKIEQQKTFSKLFFRMTFLAALLFILVVYVGVINPTYLPTFIEGIAEILFIVSQCYLVKLSKENIQLPTYANLAILGISVTVILFCFSQFIQGLLDTLLF